MTISAPSDTRSKPISKLLAAIALICLLSVSIVRIEHHEAAALSSLDAELVSLINEHRGSMQLDPYLQFAPFNDAALNWSGSMLNGRNQLGDGSCTSIGMSNDRFRVHDTAANIDVQGVPPGTTITGENIAWSCGYPGSPYPVSWTYGAMPAKCNGSLDYTSALYLFCQWIDSPLHRANLESPDFVYMGIGSVIKTSAGGQTEPLLTARFAIAPPITGCDGLTVTIDMNKNGGNGTGTAGDDVILGTPGDDVIDAGDGDDTVCAEGGDDIVVGGNGGDLIFGGPGSDILRGGPGVDTIFGEGDADRLLGGVDGDQIYGGDGDDYIGGFGGSDTIDGGSGNETIFGGFGADVITGGAGDDVIRGLIGDDTINGGDGHDLLDGDSGNDVINGGAGDDTIGGGNANDVLNGDAGNDTVSGGKADDTLSGGPGTDICVGNLQTTVDTADVTCETSFGIP